jgi:CubicO group peptidase (beta-lactamase class C family)
VERALRHQIPRDGGGAALTVVHDGEVVVDVWGGTRDEGDAPWARDTVALSFSTTKGVASTLVHVLASQGRLDYDAPIARYWPAFAHGGKGEITVRHVLSHEAGLWAIRDLVEDASQMRDWHGMLERIERARPIHAPGARNGYHGLTYGWLVGGLVEHVTGRSFADVLHDELAAPLGLDGCFVGLPPHALERRARLVGMRPPRPRTTRPRRHVLRDVRDGLIRGALSLVGRDFENFRRGLLPRGIGHFDWNALETVQACIPAATGMFTARSLARIYAMLANGGTLDGVRILAKDVAERAAHVQNRRIDDVLLFRLHWRLGYHRVLTTRGPLRHALGHFGFGGSGAWCDPSRRLAVALTLNSGIGTPLGDFRIWRLNHEILNAVHRRHEARH